MEWIASWFGIFSDMWAPSRWGDFACIFWPLNAIACGLIAIEGFALLHLSHKRFNRLAFGMVSLGGFTYLIGELSGEYSIVAPVETLFHVSMAVALASMIYKNLEFRRLKDASNNLRTQMGPSTGDTAKQYSSIPASGR